MNVNDVAGLLRKAELLNLVPREAEGTRALDRARAWQEVLGTTTFDEAQARLTRIASQEHRDFMLHPGALAVQSSALVNRTGVGERLRRERAESEAPPNHDEIAAILAKAREDADRG